LDNFDVLNYLYYNITSLSQIHYIWRGHIYKNQIKTLHMGKIYKFIKFIVK